MTRRYALRDDQWERIKALLPGRKRAVGVTAADNRRLVEAVMYRYRSGMAWRDLPDRFGDFRVIHTRHRRWSRRGVWARVFACLAEEADHAYAMIDSTIVRAHQPAAGACNSTIKRNALGARRAVYARQFMPSAMRWAIRPAFI